MKASVGVFVAGVIAAYLLDPASGQARRAKANKWLGPMGRRMQQTKDQVVESEPVATAREAAAPAVTRTLKSMASTVQGRVEDAASAVAERARRVVSRGGGSEDEAGAPSPSVQDYRAEVTPKGSIDPIPEGDPNDPTLVARVESELFRDETLPKGKLNIDAVNGVVTLRGTVGGKDVADEILERTRAIEGVTDVVDLMHRH